MRLVSPTKPQTILFDFDYTLADSSPAVIVCANSALQALGLPTAEPEAIRRTIGLSLKETFVQLAGASVPVDRFAAASETFDRLFIQEADAVMADRTVILPGVAAALQTLRRHGLALGVVSSKFRYRIEQVLEREDLRAAFDVIVGREDVIAAKPDPEGLFTGMAALGSVPPTTCYVGDSVTDAKTAQSAGTAFIAATSGVTPQAAFDAYSCRAVIASVAELPDVIAC